MTVQLRQNVDTMIASAAPVIVNDDTTIRGGLAAGTIILTARGEVAVEDLRVGDRIITRERGLSVLRAVTTRTAPACVIRMDSLGRGRPGCDTVLACDQHIAVRDWRAKALFGFDAALVPARRLADGHRIATAGTGVFFKLKLDDALTVYADGLETPTGRTDTGVVEI